MYTFVLNLHLRFNYLIFVTLLIAITLIKAHVTTGLWSGVMAKQRRRFKQTISFKDRLMSFAKDLRERAWTMPASERRDDLIERARLADTAVRIDEWANSRGLQPPK